jgi:hypothetical protein
MLAIALVSCGLRIVCPPTAAAIAGTAFAIFEGCKEVKEVRVREEEASLCRVSATLVLTNEARLSASGVAVRKERAYHAASASALYALQKHRRREEFDVSFGGPEDTRGCSR